MKILIVLACIFMLPLILTWIFPIKCPKCNKKCHESYHLPGYDDSLYYECPEHGNIDEIVKQ